MRGSKSNGFGLTMSSGLDDSFAGRETLGEGFGNMKNESSRLKSKEQYLSMKQLIQHEADRMWEEPWYHSDVMLRAMEMKNNKIKMNRQRALNSHYMSQDLEKHQINIAMQPQGYASANFNKSARSGFGDVPSNDLATSQTPFSEDVIPQQPMREQVVR
jgi:hypothetical protein